MCEVVDLVISMRIEGDMTCEVEEEKEEEREGAESKQTHYKHQTEAMQEK